MQAILIYWRLNTGIAYLWFVIWLADSDVGCVVSCDVATMDLQDVILWKLKISASLLCSSETSPKWRGDWDSPGGWTVVNRLCSFLGPMI